FTPILSAATPTRFPYTPLFRSVVGVAAAAVLALTACEPLDTGTSGSHSTVKSGKTTKKSSSKVTVHTETHSGGTTTSRRSVTVRDRKSTRLNSSHVSISYAVFC